MFSAFYKGFVDKADIIVFILIIGGAFWIVNDSKAFDIGTVSFLGRARKMENNRFLRKIGVENFLLTSIMLLFSIFGAVFGMSEETIAFCLVLVPMAISMGYDSITGVCMVFVAAGLGFAGAILNPFTIGIAQGLALGAELPMIGVSTLMTMAQGAWRKNGATRVLAAIDARMGEVYWAEYQRDENGIWHGEETEAVLKPELVHERMQQLSGEWVTVGTGWQAWPDLGKESGLVLLDGEVLLPAAEDMLPIACQMFAEGKTVAVEHAEPVYLRNNVAWKKLPGKE